MNKVESIKYVGLQSASVAACHWQLALPTVIHKVVMHWNYGASRQLCQGIRPRVSACSNVSACKELCEYLS